MAQQNRLSSVSIGIRHTLVSYQNDAPLIDKKKHPTLTIKIANTLNEREAAFRLAYQVYLNKSYVEINTNEMLINEYDQDSSTTIFIVKNQNNEIIASATLVFNDSSTLPTEKIFSQEIKKLKLSGTKITEVSRLVINPNYRNSKEILILLFNYMFIYGYHVKKFDSTIIQVNPRHKDYYKKLLHFEEVSGEKLSPTVLNAPAILLSLPLKSYHAEVIRNNNFKDDNYKIRNLYSHFLNLEQEKLVSHYLEKQYKPMSSEEKIYFGFMETGFVKAVLV